MSESMKTEGNNHNEDTDHCVDKSRAVHVPGPLHILCCWTPSHFILVLSDYCALVQWMGVGREAKHSRAEVGP